MGSHASLIELLGSLLWQIRLRLELGIIDGLIGRLQILPRLCCIDETWVHRIAAPILVLDLNLGLLQNLRHILLNLRCQQILQLRVKLVSLSKFFRQSGGVVPLIDHYSLVYALGHLYGQREELFSRCRACRGWHISEAMRLTEVLLGVCRAYLQITRV